MPKYTFEFREDFAEESVDDLELDSDDAAVNEAVRTAREIMTDGILEGIDRTGWVSRIIKENGEIIATVKFSDLVARRGHLE